MLLNVWVAEWIKWNPFLTYVPLSLPTSLLPHFLISSTPNPPLISTFTSPLSPPHLSAFLPQYHHYPSPLFGTKVLVTTEGFMSEMRSWSAPALQMSRRPTAAVTDKPNSLLFIRSNSKTPLYLVTTDQSASSTDSMPIITAFKILMRTAQKISVSTHPPKYNSNLVQGWVNTTHFSLGAVHSENGFETGRLHYIVNHNVTSSARNQAESSI